MLQLPFVPIRCSLCSIKETNSGWTWWGSTRGSSSGYSEVSSCVCPPIQGYLQLHSCLVALKRTTWALLGSSCFLQSWIWASCWSFSFSVSTEQDINGMSRRIRKLAVLSKYITNIVTLVILRVVCYGMVTGAWFVFFGLSLRSPNKRAIIPADLKRIDRIQIILNWKRFKGPKKGSHNSLIPNNLQELCQNNTLLTDSFFSNGQRNSNERAKNYFKFNKSVF